MYRLTTSTRGKEDSMPANITPPAQRVLVKPMAVMNLPTLIGPAVVILVERQDTGERSSIFVDPAAVAARTVNGEVEMSGFDDASSIDIAVSGWPMDWPPSHIGNGLARAIAVALAGGLEWSRIKERVEIFAVRATAGSN